MKHIFEDIPVDISSYGILCDPIVKFCHGCNINNILNLVARKRYNTNKLTAMKIYVTPGIFRHRTEREFLFLYLVTCKSLSRPQLNA